MATSNLRITLITLAIHTLGLWEDRKIVYIRSRLLYLNRMHGSKAHDRTELLLCMYLADIIKYCLNQCMGIKMHNPCKDIFLRITTTVCRQHKVTTECCMHSGDKYNNDLLIPLVYRHYDNSYRNKVTYVPPMHILLEHFILYSIYKAYEQPTIARINPMNLCFYTHH